MPRFGLFFSDEDHPRGFDRSVIVLTCPYELYITTFRLLEALKGFNFVVLWILPCENAIFFNFFTKIHHIQKKGKRHFLL